MPHSVAASPHIHVHPRPPCCAADIARREKLGSVGEEEGVLSGDSLELSMDLERSGTGSVPPSPLAAAGGAAAQQAVARPNAEGKLLAGVRRSHTYTALVYVHCPGLLAHCSLTSFVAPSPLQLQHLQAARLCQRTPPRLPPRPLTSVVRGPSRSTRASRASSGVLQGSSSRAGCFVSWSSFCLDVTHCCRFTLTWVPALASFPRVCASP